MTLKLFNTLVHLGISIFMYLNKTFNIKHKEFTYNAGDLGSIPGLVRSPGEGKRLPTPVFWPGEFQGLYSPWGSKELDTTEQLSLSFSMSESCFHSEVYPCMCSEKFRGTCLWLVSYSLREVSEVCLTGPGDSGVVGSLSLFLKLFRVLLGREFLRFMTCPSAPPSPKLFICSFLWHLWVPFLIFTVHFQLIHRTESWLVRHLIRLLLPFHVGGTVL